jgi:hypothetical protein
MLAGCAAIGVAGPRRAVAADGSPEAAPTTGTLVLYQPGEVWEEVPPTEGTAKSVDDLELIVDGLDRVQFRGKTYSVAREGLYRFMILPKGVRNLIRLRDRQSLLPLLRSLSALQVHGNRHDGDGLERLKSRLLTEPWVSITCGNTAALAASVLNGQGYKTRRVDSQTLEKPNGYDDGHSLFEVYWPEAKKWVLVDADMGLLFKEGSAFLGAEELAERVKQNRRPELVALAQKAAVLDPYFLGPDGYNYALEFRWRWGTDEEKWRWYRRVMQRVNIRQ